MRLEKLTVAQKVANVDKSDMKAVQIGTVLLIVGEFECKCSICDVIYL